MKPEIFDPRWRLNNLYKIRTKNKKIIKFKENNIQKSLNDSSADLRRYMILKARQFGISTNEILKIFDNTVFNKNVISCILAHERDALEKLFEIVLVAYENMPKPKPILAKGGGSKYELKFPGLGSKIYVDLEVRGGTNHNLHVSELAFFKDKSKFNATLETVPVNGHVSIETTPNGMNFFYDFWNDPDSGFKKFFFPWFCFNEYQIDEPIKIYTQEELELKEKALKYAIKITPEQIAFRRFKKGQNKETFLQEYPEDENTCFLTTGNPFFNLEIIKIALLNLKKPINQSDTLKIFAEPTHTNYVAGVDTAEGVGNDFCVMVLYDVKTQEQVLTLRGHWRPSIFAERMNAVLSKYPNQFGVQPLLAIERNNHGHAVLLAMQNLKYSNLFIDKDDRPGWLTNSVSRPIMLNGFKDFLETTPDKIKCKTTLTECLTFVNNNGKIEAIDGKHDDCIIANCIAVQMLIKELSSPDYSSMANDFIMAGGDN